MIYKNQSEYIYTVLGIYKLNIQENLFYAYIKINGSETETIKEMEQKDMIIFIG